jgi:uncharacterized protein (TIGR02246 family)
VSDLTKENDPLKATTPEQIHQCFERALAARDLDAMVDIYTDDAVIVPEAGQVLRGADAIREHLSGLLAMSPELESETTVNVRAGDTAMLRARWKMRIRTPAGEADITGESTEVLRLGADGVWKCVIDNPYSA